jgi:polyisoprenoid-binding protein YceI
MTHSPTGHAGPCVDATVSNATVGNVTVSNACTMTEDPPGHRPPRSNRMGLRDSISRHRRRWAIGVVAGLVIVVVGGLLIIKVIQGKGDKALTINDAPVVTSGGTSAGTGNTTGQASGQTTGSAAGIDGTWKIATGSQVGYRVKETLFGQSATATGRTTAVTGTLTITGTDVSAGQFTVEMAKVTSDRSQRDGQFRGRIMAVDQYPTATFALTKPIALASLPVPGVEIHAQATGDLTLHGTKRSVTFTVTARRTADAIQVQGQIPVTFGNYGIDNPSGGPASVGDNGILEFALAFARA